MTFKKNFMKKMTGIICGLALSTVLIFSVPVNAASSVTSNYKIDFAYASGWCGYSSSTASAYTAHLLHTTKKVTLTAYASYSGHYCLYGSTTSTADDLNPVSANISFASGFIGIGAKATHKVTGTTGSTWTGNTNSGYYE